MRQKLSLPLGGKEPSESEANEGRDMLFSSGFLAVILGFPFGEAVGDSRLKRSSSVMSSLGASRHSPRRGKQENDEPPKGKP